MFQEALQLGLDSRPMQQGAKAGEQSLDRLGRSGKKAAQDLDQVEKRASRMSTTFGKLARGAAALGLGLSVAFAAQGALRSLKEFDEQISSVLAVIDKASRGQIKELAAQAKELGASTRFAASEAAAGQAELARAGFSANEILAALPATLSLAIAGQLGLGEASGITAISLRQFSLAATETERVADVLAVTAANSTTTIGQLAEGFKYVGPVAASLGRDFEEVAATLGTLANAGIQGTMAGTGLKIILSQLAAPTAEVEDAIKSLGLTMADVNPRAHSLSEIFTTLAKAGLGVEEAFAIAGQRGGVALTTLVRNTSGLTELESKTRKATGAVAEMAKTMDDNLGGSIKALRSALEGLVLAAGDAGLLKVLRSTIDTLTLIVRAVSGSAEAVEDLGWKWDALRGIVVAFLLLKVAEIVAGWVGALYKLSGALLAASAAAEARGMINLAGVLFGGARGAEALTVAIKGAVLHLGAFAIAAGIATGAILLWIREFRNAQAESIAFDTQLQKHAGTVRTLQNELASGLVNASTIAAARKELEQLGTDLRKAGLEAEALRKKAANIPKRRETTVGRQRLLDEAAEIDRINKGRTQAIAQLQRLLDIDESRVKVNNDLAAIIEDLNSDNARHDARELTDYEKNLAKLKQTVAEQRVLNEARSLSVDLFDRLVIAQAAGFSITKKITDEVWEQVNALKAATEQAELRSLVENQTFKHEKIDVSAPKPFSDAQVKAEQAVTDSLNVAGLVLERGFVKASDRLRREMSETARDFVDDLLDIEFDTQDTWGRAGALMARAFGDELKGAGIFEGLFAGVGSLLSDRRTRNLAGILTGVGGDMSSPIYQEALNKAEKRNERFGKAIGVFSAAVTFYAATQKTARNATEQEALNQQKGAAIAQAGAATGVAYLAIAAAVIGFIVANKKVLGFDQYFGFGEQQESLDLRTGTTGVQPGVRSLQTGSKVFAEAGQRFTEFNNLIRRQFNLLLAELGGFLEGFSGATQLFIKGNEEFIVTLHTGVKAVFQNEQDALQAVIADLLRHAQISGLDPLLQAGLDESTASTFEEFADDLRFLQQVARAALPETSRAVLEMFDAFRVSVEKLFLLIEDAEQRARGVANLREDLLRQLDRQNAELLGIEIDPSAEARQKAETINKQIAKLIESVFKTIGDEVYFNSQEVIDAVTAAGYDASKLDAIFGTAAVGEASNAFARMIEILKSGQPVTNEFKTAVQAMLNVLVEAGKLAAADAAFIGELLGRIIDPAAAAAASGGAGSGRRSRREQREALDERVKQLDLSRLSEIARALADLDDALARDAEQARVSGYEIDKLTAAYARQRNFLLKEFLTTVDEFIAGSGGELDAILSSIEDKATELTTALQELADAGEISRRQFNRLADAIAEAATNRAIEAIGDAQTSLQLELLGILGMDKEAAEIRYNITLAELQLKREQLAIALAEYGLSLATLNEIDKLIEKVKEGGPKLFGGGETPVTKSGPTGGVKDDRDAILAELRELQNRRLTSLNREFLELTDKLADLEKRAKAAHISLAEIDLARASAIGDFFREKIVGPLQDFFDEFNGSGPDSILSPLAQQKDALDKLNALAAAARSGDLDAYAKIPDAGREYLRILEASFGRGEEFAKGLNQVNSITQALIDAGIQQAQNAGGELAAEIARAREDTISKGEEEIANAVRDLLRSQEADAVQLRKTVREMADEIAEQNRNAEALRVEIRRLVSRLDNE